ncbi:MAG: AzlD domain-containing protein [Bacillota bacterium]
MANSEYLIIIIGMALVTYIPRMFPLVILSDLELTSFWRRFLYYIPPAALSALIFPGILNATDSSSIAITGGFVAAIMAYLKFNLLTIVLSAIVTVFLLQFLI